MFLDKSFFMRIFVSDMSKWFDLRGGMKEWRAHVVEGVISDNYQQQDFKYCLYPTSVEGIVLRIAPKDSA